MIRSSAYLALAFVALLFIASCDQSNNSSTESSNDPEEVLEQLPLADTVPTNSAEMQRRSEMDAQTVEFGTPAEKGE